MYILKTNASFDSAHFLPGYKGKCNNIHGHRWKVEVEIYDTDLKTDKQCEGMLIDFNDLKNALKKVTSKLDHTFIIQKASLKKTTIDALLSEGFSLYEVDFRPTAENIAKFIFDELKSENYKIKQVTVYETPNNCACYSERIF